MFTFVRNRGEPHPDTETFPATPGVSCKLRLYNGGLGGEFDRVSSAVIRLNGVQIIGPSHFNQQVELIERSVTLKKLNELWVEENGKYYGDALKMPEGYALGWSYIPHFIHVRFYT